MVEHSGREPTPLGCADVASKEVEACLIHAYKADGCKVIIPVTPEAFADVAKVELRIRVEVFLGETLQDLALGFQAVAGDVHESVQLL